jgi:hypothetical protein
VAFYNRIKDPFLTDNLINNWPVPEKEFQFLKAIIQQYNNRMIEDRLTVRK